MARRHRSAFWKLRTSRGYHTQSTLALAAGISAGYLGMIEHGRQPTDWVVRTLAKVLRTTRAKVLHAIDDSAAPKGDL